jgi:Flp pilus assembly protein CpaB
MFRNRDKFELLTLLLGVAAIIAFFWYLKDDRQRVDILVTTSSLEPGTVLTADHVRLQQWPPAFLLKDTIMAKDQSKVVGAIVVERIAEGEPLRSHHLAKPSDVQDVSALSFSDRASSIIKDPELRLLSWPLDQSGVLNGRVKAGDLIDIIITVRDPQSKKEFTKTLRQAVRVVAITQKDMLFMLPLQEVEAFIFAKSAGTINFALTAVNPKEVETTGVDYQILYDRWLRPAIAPSPSEDSASNSTVPTPTVGVTSESPSATVTANTPVATPFAEQTPVSMPTPLP